jgi:hypothetical protein
MSILTLDLLSGSGRGNGKMLTKNLMKRVLVRRKEGWKNPES